ncbi:MAG: chloride channel protein [Alphaproteobacteria bacterium]|nr:chloride channel protein [Alphaproteobacteria bacterium]
MTEDPARKAAPAGPSGLPRRYAMHDNAKRFRRIHALMLSPKMWRRRLVFWTGAICVGVVSVYFALFADKVQDIFATLSTRLPLLPLAMSPLMFFLSAWLVARYCPSTPGSGIPQAIAAHALQGEKERKYLLGPRVIAGKMLLTFLALLGGGSIGREGPTVQVGAALMMLSARFGRMTGERDIVLAGAAAGVAAAFNTPLAGIIFAIEEMARGFHHRSSGVVLMAIVLSGAASMSVLGNYNYFGYADTVFDLARDSTAIVVTGVVGGFLGALFSLFLTKGGKYLRDKLHGMGSRHPLWFAAFCGLIIALLGLATHGATYGTGYTLANDLLHERTSVSWGYVGAKLLATVFSGFSGVPGGIFSPSLSVGAAVGSALSPWLGHTPMQGVILLGMCAYFAGVTQAPITSFVIVLEVTGKGVMPAPLIAAAVLAAAVSRLLMPMPLYHVLAHRFLIDARKFAAPPEPVPEPEPKTAAEIPPEPETAPQETSA